VCENVCLYYVSVCSVTGSLVSSDHTTLALASTLSIFLVLFAVFIFVLVLCEFSSQATYNTVYNTPILTLISAAVLVVVVLMNKCLTTQVYLSVATKQHVFIKEIRHRVEIDFKRWNFSFFLSAVPVYQ